MPAHQMVLKQNQAREIPTIAACSLSIKPAPCEAPKSNRASWRSSALLGALGEKKITDAPPAQLLMQNEIQELMSAETLYVMPRTITPCPNGADIDDTDPAVCTGRHCSSRMQMLLQVKILHQVWWPVPLKPRRQPPDWPGGWQSDYAPVTARHSSRRAQRWTGQCSRLR